MKAMDIYLTNTDKHRRMVHFHPLNYVEYARKYWIDQSNGINGIKFRDFIEQLEAERIAIIREIYSLQKSTFDQRFENLKSRI